MANINVLVAMAMKATVPLVQVHIGNTYYFINNVLIS